MKMPQYPSPEACEFDSESFLPMPTGLFSDFDYQHLNWQVAWHEGWDAANYATAIDMLRCQWSVFL